MLDDLVYLISGKYEILEQKTFSLANVSGVSCETSDSCQQSGHFSNYYLRSFVTSLHEGGWSSKDGVALNF